MATKQKAAKEVKQEGKGETPPKIDNLIRGVYLITPKGTEVLEGVDAEVDIQGIKGGSNGDDRPYTFYKDGMPIYIAIKNGTYSPLVFPEPGPDVSKGESGMTSMELYGLSVTLASTIEKIIELETEPKPSLLDQARKIMTPTLVIAGSILAIFLLAVIMKG